MTDAASPYVPRPPMAFRVGITGARDLPEGSEPRLRAEFAALLAHVRDTLFELAQDPSAAQAHAPASPDGPPVLLRLVSPLAEGADRLVAEEGLKAGYALYAPLPFPQAVYEKDFEKNKTVDAFRALLAQAETFELDGAAGNFAPESYREVGRFVVRNCDLLIAVWDGEREKGPGGTAEIVRYAANARVPIWRIDPTGAKPTAFIETPAHLRDDAATKAPTGDEARKNLGDFLRAALVPPEATPLDHGGVFGLIAHLFAKHAQPLDDYLHETPRAASFASRAFGNLMRRYIQPDDRPLPALNPAATRAETWWERFHDPADKLSIAYGDRYRSSYVWIARFAFLALTGAAVSLVAPQLAGFLHLDAHGFEMVISGVELLALLMIAYVVIVNHACRWHERWIAYRLLAELCRKQFVLSSLGRTLPSTEAYRASEHDGGKLPRDAWVAWYFAAAQRAAPFPLGSMATAKPHAKQLALSLVQEQTVYHFNRERRNAAAGRSVQHAGEWFFGLAVLFTAAKLGAQFVEHGEHLGKWFAMAGGIVSAATAAIVGVRAYSEFSLLARQSAHMGRVMIAAKAEFDAIDPDAPLAARDLGRALYTLTLSMLQDVGGWAQLFRIKTLEAGG